MSHEDAAKYIEGLDRAVEEALHETVQEYHNAHMAKHNQTSNQ